MEGFELQKRYSAYDSIDAIDAEKNKPANVLGHYKTAAKDFSLAAVLFSGGMSVVQYKRVFIYRAKFQLGSGTNHFTTSVACNFSWVVARTTLLHSAGCDYFTVPPCGPD